jgi:Uma2 family endonuclease
MVAHEKVTLEAFRQFVGQPENADRLFELINGEIVEKMPGRVSNSAISTWFIFLVRLFCREHSLPCYISGEAGTYDIQGHIVAPDFAYRTIPFSTDYPEPVAPLWVVEIISPNDKPRDIRAKRMIYLAAGILYWELWPEEQSVDVYAPGQPMRTYGIEDTIDVGDLIPGFTLALRDLFEN